MSHQAEIVARMQRVREEMDQCAEWWAQIATDAASTEPVTGPDLLGVHEVAALTGRARETIHTHRRRGNFPPPLVELACGPIWLRSDIQRWIESKRAA